MRLKFIPIAGLLLGALMPVARGADRDFEAVVRTIEGHMGVQRTHIPMLGVAKFFVRASAPSGAHSFELATFENLRYSPQRMGEFREAVSGALSRSWQPMVQVHAQGRLEYTGIFVKGERGKFQLLIATIEAHEATVIAVRVNPAQLFDWLRSPAEMKQRANASSRDEDCCLEE